MVRHQPLTPLSTHSSYCCAYRPFLERQCVTLLRYLDAAYPFHQSEHWIRFRALQIFENFQESLKIVHSLFFLSTTFLKKPPSKYKFSPFFRALFFGKEHFDLATKNSPLNNLLLFLVQIKDQKFKEVTTTSLTLQTS